MRRGRGRPPVAEGEATRRVTVNLPESLAARLDGLRGDVPLSEYLRAVVAGARAPGRVWLLWEGVRLVSVHGSRSRLQEAAARLREDGPRELEAEAREVE